MSDIRLTRKWTVSSNSCDPRGAFTLVELVAGMILLGGLGVSVMMACNDLESQRRSAMAKLEATEVAEQLLGDWFAAQTRIPRSGSGNCANAPNWYWRTKPQRRVRIGTTEADVILVEIFERSPGQSRLEEVRLRVELVVPSEEFTPTLSSR